jgi:hypothetical protein
MKRASYAIPLAGISLVACGDPIVGTWEVTNFEDKVLPYDYSSDDDDSGVICDGTVSGEMIVDKNFASAIVLSGVAVCSDGTTNNEESLYLSDFVVIEKGAKYTLNINDGGEAFPFDCTMLNQNILNCVDDDANLIAFALKPE